MSRMNGVEWMYNRLNSFSKLKFSNEPFTQAAIRMRSLGA